MAFIWKDKYESLETNFSTISHHGARDLILKGPNLTVSLNRFSLTAL